MSWVNAGNKIINESAVPSVSVLPLSMVSLDFCSCKCLLIAGSENLKVTAVL